MNRLPAWVNDFPKESHLKIFLKRITFVIFLTFINGFDVYSQMMRMRKFLHKCHIWNLFDLHDCFLSSDENDKIIFDKNHIWNLFYIHEWFWSVLSDDVNEKMIFHKCHIWIFLIFMNFFHIYSQITIIFTFKIYYSIRALMVSSSPKMELVLTINAWMPD